MFSHAAGLLPAEDEPLWDAVHRRMAPPLDGLVTWHVDLPGDRAAGPRSSRTATRCTSSCATRTAPSPRRRPSRSASAGSRSAGSTCSSTAQRVYIRGVNRHDFDQHTGRVVSVESMRADLVLMKQFGFNADPDLALPERPGLPRPDRRARDVRRRRGRHRVARLPEHAVRRPPLPVPVGRPRLADGPARQEPPVGHPLVARQRVRATARTTRRPPPGSAATTRAGRSTTRARSATTGRATRASATSPARCTRRSRRSSATPGRASSGTR